jgi:hypothetical protein
MANIFPRETVEFQPVTITLNGVAVITGVTFSVVKGSLRPGTFVAPTTLNGKIGVMVTGLTAGTYHVWAQITSSPETPVIDGGYFTIN